MNARPLHGQPALLRALGQHVRGLRRWVLDLGGANDEFGHGVTVFDLDEGAVTLRPGPNEDFIVAEQGAPLPSEFPSEHWTHVDLVRQGLWKPPVGLIDRIDLFTDEIDDVAARLHFDTGEEVVVALVNTDLVVSPDLTVLNADPEIEPRLRETLR